MPQEIQKILEEAAKDTLTPELLEQINEAVEKVVSVRVDAALAKQDQEHLDKFSQLYESVDRDHTIKMMHLVSSARAKYKQELKKLKTQMINESKQFQDALVKKLGVFLDNELQKHIPVEMVAEAVANTAAAKTLETIKKVTNISAIQQNKMVLEAMEDGHNTIASQKAKIDSLEKKLSALEESAQADKAKTILEEKVAKLPITKRNYMRTALKGKGVEYITENFDHVLALYDKDEKQLRREVLNVTKPRTSDVDNKLITESKQTPKDTPASDVSPLMSAAYDNLKTL